jgi:hypothetical protein
LEAATIMTAYDGRCKGARNYHARKQREVEAEHDGLPLREVLEGYRRDGVPWSVIAGICGVSHVTLILWRRWLGLPVPDRPVPADRSRTRERVEALAARIAGCRQTMTVAQTAAHLGIHPATVTRLTPPDAKGRYVHTPEGLRRRREAGRARWATGRAKAPAPDHPWRGTLWERRGP